MIDGELSTQGWNRFAYVHNNPIRHKDPTGHGAQGDALLAAHRSDKDNTPVTQQLNKESSKEKNSETVNSVNNFLQKSKDNAKSSLNPRPLPMPKELIGTDYYYKLRHIDAENRGIMPPDYYKEYGDKYLHKFKYETRPNLSEGGKKWCDDTLVNLQKSMEKTLEKNPEIEKDNKKFRESAFDSHPDAYLKAGFWEKTSWNDKKEIGWTPDFKDLFKPEGIKQVVEMVKKAPIENIVKEMIK